MREKLMLKYNTMSLNNNIQFKNSRISAMAFWNFIEKN